MSKRGGGGHLALVFCQATAFFFFIDDVISACEIINYSLITFIKSVVNLITEAPGHVVLIQC